MQNILLAKNYHMKPYNFYMAVIYNKTATQKF